MKKPKSLIDKDWFITTLESKEKSLRGLARHMELDVSGVSRMLSGQRKMKMTEANKIAQFLGMHVSEVLRHSGVELEEGSEPSRILLAATINETGQVKKVMEPMHLPQSIMDRAQAAITIRTGTGRIIAAQVRALKGPLALLDDAVMLFGHTDRVEADAIGSLSICRNREGEQILAKIERARKTGEARVICTDNNVREFTLHTATPILAIIP